MPCAGRAQSISLPDGVKCDQNQALVSIVTFSYGLILHMFVVFINYCLFNAMHGQNINLPVHVFVSVTLSVNSPTGQTPQRIFTVDSLKYAHLHKDVPFGGLSDEYLHLCVQSPLKPPFRGPE